MARSLFSGALSVMNKSMEKIFVKFAKSGFFPTTMPINVGATLRQHEANFTTKGLKYVGFSMIQNC